MTAPNDDIPVSDSERHNTKMARKKQARDKIMATKTEEKGLIMVHTGAGKGKSSSGFGMIMRCIAHSMPCAVVQFIKGTWMTGERKLLTEQFAQACTFVVSGEGFTWETQDRARDIAAAQAAWEASKEMVEACRGDDPPYDLILLDELNIVLRYDYLPLADVVEFLRNKPEGLHVIVTGRNAKPELMDAADMVTEMTMVKHHFKAGVKAQVGIEF